MADQETVSIKEGTLREVVITVGAEIEFANQFGKRFLIANHRGEGGYFTCIPIIKGKRYTYLGDGSTHPISDAFTVIGYWNLDQVVKGIEDFFRNALDISQAASLPENFVSELDWQREHYRPILGKSRMVSLAS